MTPDEIRADMASRQKQLDALTATQKERAQELAEVLCPFKVGDKVKALVPHWAGVLFRVVGFRMHCDLPGALVIVEGDGGPQDGQRCNFPPEKLRKISPEPAPDPEVEAVRNVAHERFDMLLTDKHARTIIAALDAVRAERRAKAQDARVKAIRLLEEFSATLEAAMSEAYTAILANDHPAMVQHDILRRARQQKRDEIKAAIAGLAAADAAEAGDG